MMLILGSQIATQAQDGPRGGFQRRTVEERVKMAHDKLDSAFKPTAEKLKALDDIFTEFFGAQDKMMQEMRSSGERPDREVMGEKIRTMMQARDEKLKKEMTAEQYEIWKKQIEPGMRPQRGGGGPRRDGGNR